MNVFKTALLLAAMTALLGAFGYLLDRVLGTGGLMMMLFFGIGIVMNWVSYFFSDSLVLKMTGAQEVTPEEAPMLHRIVERLAARAGIPKPKVCVVQSDVPNAFATGRNPQHAAVAATTTILRALSEEELEGVLAHELGHIRNRDTLISTVAATIAGAIGMLSQTAQWGSFFGMGGHRDRDSGGGNPLFAVLLIVFAFVAPIIAMLVQMAISRTREFSADRFSAELTGRPESLASALMRLESFAMARPAKVPPGTQHLFIVNPLSGSAAASLFSTHPPTEARIAALREIQQELQTKSRIGDFGPGMAARQPRMAGFRS